MQDLTMYRATIRYIFKHTGILTGFDLNMNGEVGDAGDAHGYGDFPGAFSVVLLSHHPFDVDNIRTFKHFLWKDASDANLPIGPESGGMHHSEEELNVLRPSSKNHRDILIVINAEGEVVHVLMSHSTPPVFDDGTATEYSPER
ncbi:predicted protein [Thalassiosira pseudonana CCMP1335]|uniref:Uncharacterized protein n=1 Tax=Thalassiosira pseudonana TaxID=35128 RepID=B8C1L1_THAPS|nr:predicted protein [Thalassiosira pseudonana CCMP1335]EED91789.1 predicted protein [Thalassiosira pseudonana CCMP1335]